MCANRALAADIVDVFDSFLASKNIEIHCADPEEEAERHDDDNCACLYGMEYWSLVDRIEFMLNAYKEEK
jgi:hypothetical protein